MNAMNTVWSKVKGVRGFLSWIVFALFPNSEVAWAALAGLAVALVLFIQDRRRGVPLDALILDISTLIFFAATGAAGFADPHAPLGNWSSALSFGWLAITAWGTIALRQPFTLGLARQRVPREVWGRPAFRQSQLELTRLWAVLFTVLAALLAVCTGTHQGTLLGLSIRLAALSIGAHLTSRHIKASRLRMAAVALSADAV